MNDADLWRWAAQEREERRWQAKEREETRRREGLARAQEIGQRQVISRDQWERHDRTGGYLVTETVWASPDGTIDTEHEEFVQD